MIIDSKTGKVLVTSKQLIKVAKEYFASLSNKEFRNELAKEMRIDRKKGIEQKNEKAIEEVSKI